MFTKVIRATRGNSGSPDNPVRVIRPWFFGHPAIVEVRITTQSETEYMVEVEEQQGKGNIVRDPYGLHYWSKYHPRQVIGIGNWWGVRSEMIPAPYTPDKRAREFEVGTLEL